MGVFNKELHLPIIAFFCENNSAFHTEDAVFKVKIPFSNLSAET
jgi:hypothetical protein